MGENLLAGCEEAEPCRGLDRSALEKCVVRNECFHLEPGKQSICKEISFEYSRSWVIGKRPFAWWPFAWCQKSLKYRSLSLSLSLSLYLSLSISLFLPSEQSREPFTAAEELHPGD